MRTPHNASNYAKQFPKIFFVNMSAWRSMHSKNSAPSDKDFAKASQIVNYIRSHPNRSVMRDLEDNLRDISKEGLSEKQMLVFRDNFFYRTANTLVVPAVLLRLAAGAGDYKAVSNAAHVIHDEGVGGSAGKPHPELLQDCLNTFAYALFKSPPTTIVESAHSLLLTPQAKAFREMQEKVFDSKDYPTVVGCFLAHEDGADGMLVAMYKGLFGPYFGRLTAEEKEKVEAYFKAHKDEEVKGGDVEEQHGKMALEIVARIIAADPEDEKRIVVAADEFCVVHSKLWESLLQKMHEAGKEGRKISPLSEAEVPNSAPSQATATSQAVLDKCRS